MELSTFSEMIGEDIASIDFGNGRVLKIYSITAEESEQLMKLQKVTSEEGTAAFNTHLIFFHIRKGIVGLTIEDVRKMGWTVGPGKVIMNKILEVMKIDGVDIDPSTFQSAQKC